MKNSLSIIFNLVVALSLSLSLSANNYQDSLLAVYTQTQDTSKFSIGIQLTRSLASTDMSQALNLANDMYTAAQQSKDIKSIAKCQNVLGILYRRNMEIDISLTFLNQAANNYQKIGALESIVGTENNIGNLYYTEGDLINALHHFFKADSICSTPNYSGKHNTISATNAAVTLTEVGLFDLSNDFYKKALATSNFRSLEGSIYMGLLFNSLEQDKLYSSNNYYKKLEKIEIPTSSYDYVEKLLYGSYYQFLAGKKNEGTKRLNEAEKTLEGYEKDKGSANQYLVLAKVLLIGGQNQKALKYAQVSRNLLKGTKNLHRIKKALNIALQASTRLNLTSSQQLATALDSIDDAIIQKSGLNILRIVNLQAAFEEVTQVKEQISIDSDEKTEEITERTKTQKIGIMIIFALLMLGAMLFMSIRQMKGRQKELEEHKRLLKAKHDRAKKSHEEIIDEKDKLLDLVFTKARDIVVLCKIEKDGKIIIKSINQALDLVNSNYGLNLTKSQFIGKSLTSILNNFPFSDIGSIDHKLKAAQEAINTNKTVVYESNYTLNSNIVNMEVNIEPIISDDGKDRHILYTLKDISRRVKKERQHIQALLQAEDHERERIAKELHDGLGQNLTASQLYLDGFLTDKKQEEFEGLFNARKYLNLGLDECRNLSHNLIPKSISDIGLGETLIQLISDLNKLNKSQIVFNSNLTNTKIPESIALNMYRITQEAISNALKYSESTKISVQLLLFDEILTLSIEDNGKGFDKQKVLKDKSFGLHSILNRSEYIGANVNMDSNLNEGTVISVEIEKHRLG